MPGELAAHRLSNNILSLWMTRAMRASSENEENGVGTRPEPEPVAVLATEPDQQVSMIRRRRKYSKKRPTATTRDPTPARDLERISTTTETEDDVRPKTPERRRRRTPKRSGSESVKKEEDKESFVKTITTTEDSEVASKQHLTRKEELMNFFDKAKSSITRSKKDRFKKAVQRSKSTPCQLTEKDLIESFRRAQLFDAQQQSRRKYSTESSIRSSPERLNFKPLRPEATQLIKERKKPKEKITSKKVIEIIDPNIVKQPSGLILVPKVTLKNLYYISKTYTIKSIRNHWKLYKNELHKECKHIKNLRNKCICHILIILIYCGIGGIVFKFTEGAFENYYKCGVKRVKRDFIDVLWQKSHNLREEDWKSLARNRLRMFEDELHQAHEAGMHSYSGQRAWSFMNGITYCWTVISTVGYGHMYPTTVTGRALTIVYAIIGIPLFLIALTDFGKLFTRCIKFFWSFIRRLYYTGSCRKVRKTAHVQEIFKGAQLMYEIATFRRPSQFNLDPESGQLPAHTPVNPEVGNDTPTTPAISNFEIDDDFNLPISVAIFILVLYIFLGAVFYSLCENWDFFTSFYFVFISMSTIGFGDKVPARVETTIVSITYLVFGLALMSMCINVVQVKLSDTFQHASLKIGATIGLQVAEDDGSITTVPPVPVEMPEVHDGTKDVEDDGQRSVKESEEVKDGVKADDEVVKEEDGKKDV